MAKIKIKSSDGVGAQIYIDGKKVNGVTKFNLSQAAGEIPVLKLDVIASQIDLDTVCILDLPDIYKPFYERKNEPFADDSKS